eukprot:5555476-Prymnesium_polylepis.1
MPPPPSYATDAQLSTTRGLQPIADDNRGHQMLRQMGWDGGALGRSDQDGNGIMAPIEVEVRRGREGLGA